MKKVNYILRLATTFEYRAADDQTSSEAALPERTRDFYYIFKDFLGTHISIPDLKDWLLLNASILEGRIRRLWDINIERDIETYDMGNRKVVISKKPNPPESWSSSISSPYEVLQSSLLEGTGTIPRLYFFIGQYSIPYTPTSVPRELAHEYWLYEAIDDIFIGSRFESSEKRIESFSKFYKENINKINRIRKLFQSPPSKLGSGLDGVAFSIGPNFVLKIFRQEHSYNEAMKAWDRLHKHPELAKTEAMIYDVGVLGNYGSFPVYYYIMERMKAISELSDSMQDRIGYLVERIGKRIEASLGRAKGLREDIKDPTKFTEIEKLLKSFTENLTFQLFQTDTAKIEIIRKDLNLKGNWLGLLVEEILIKYLTGRGDLHTGNLGITQQGELRYFDPAHPNWTSQLNV